MCIKKIMLLSAMAVTSIITATAIANEFLPNPNYKFTENKNFYIEGHLGYARQNYFSNEQWIAPVKGPGEGTNYNNNSNVNGGFSAGVDGGYQINKNFAVELGWFYLPNVNVMQSASPAAYLTSWALYLAAKYMMPLPWMNDTDAFFKLGAEYRQATLPAAALFANGGYNTSTSHSTFIRPMFATGLNHYCSKSFSGIIQYSFFMGANNSFPLLTSGTGSLGTVSANVFTLGLGYHFAV